MTRNDPNDKSAYEDKIDAQLRECKARLDLMRAKADKASADAKIALQREIESLREKQERVKEKLHELRQAGESGWERVKTGVEAARSEMADSLERLADHVR